jgi:hypothetical protein
MNYSSVEDRLQNSDDWVGRSFWVLHESILALNADIRVIRCTRGEGLGYKLTRRLICRIDPKQHDVAIGVTNDIRPEVKATGRLREERKGKAWFNQRESNPQDESIRLIQAAFESVRASA